MENLTETKLTSEKIYNGCILDFYRDTVRLPNGGTAPRELTRHVGAVCIVPLLDDGRVIVERQFRYPVNEVITEIPAGKRDSRDEAPDDAARRELREETGITAQELIPLGAFCPAAAHSICSTAKNILQSNRNVKRKILPETQFTKSLQLACRTA